MADDALNALIRRLRHPALDVPVPARTDAEDDGGAFFERNDAWPDRGSVLPSESGLTRGDIMLPRDRTPLDSNRLADVNTNRYGKNQSAIDRTVYPLDTNRLPESGSMPFGGRGREDEPPAPRPSPLDALREFFGGKSAQDPVTELAGLRHDRKRVLEMGGNGEGNRRYQLDLLNRDIGDDPFSGDKEDARVRGVQSVLDSAATTMRPEVGDAAETVAKRNAFADFLKTRSHAMGEFEAAGSPEAVRAAEVPFQAKAGQFAQQAADADLERQQKLRMSPTLVPGQMPTGNGASDGDSDIPGFSMPPNMKPLGADAEKAIRSMRQVAPMIGALERTLDPSQSQIPNAVTSRAKWGLYGVGLAPTNPADQARLQLASLISIAGSAPYLAGSRNYEYLKQVQQHLTDPKATDQFLYNQVQELKKLWPQMQREIMKAHIHPEAPLDFGDGDLPVTDPNRGR